MGMDNIVFLENIEWLDETGQGMVHRVPTKGSGEIKWGASLTVRESQAAVLFYKGKAWDAFEAGRHTLKTGNIPILNKVLAIPWGMSSPLRAEVYFTNLKVFPNLKWGTRDPVAFKDDALGTVRLRAFGIYDLRVVQPVLFINSLVGTQGRFTTDEIEEYLGRVIVSRFNDFLGENLDTLFNLPGQYDELSEGLKQRLARDFAGYGLLLNNLYINSITPPPEVQQAIDDKSRLGLFDDLDKLVKMKAAMALEKASENPSGDASAGMGLGMGMYMPAMFMQAAQPSGPATAAGGGGPATSPAPGPEQIACSDCGKNVPKDSRFCPHCGAQLLVLDKCGDCGKNLPPGAKFCPRCGAAAEVQVAQKFCSQCGSENLPTSVFCNQCGNKL